MHKVFSVAFADVYPLYVKKVERKGRTEAELREVTEWLTGYDEATLSRLIEERVELRTFFEGAQLNPKCELITGSICGVKIAEINDPLMKNIRYLDKRVDELAKGRPMEKVRRE